MSAKSPMAAGGDGSGSMPLWIETTAQLLATSMQAPRGVPPQDRWADGGVGRNMGGCRADDELAAGAVCVARMLPALISL